METFAKILGDSRRGENSATSHTSVTAMIKDEHVMKALVLTSPGAFEVREVPVPKAGTHEVLCRIRGVAICGSDPEIIRGGLAGTWPPSYPFIAGHEWSGEVVEVGDGVLGFKPGEVLHDQVGFS